MKTDEIPQPSPAKATSRSPWRTFRDARYKLKQSREECKKRKMASYYQENKDWLLPAARSRRHSKRGIPPDAPPLKPWDWVKGRVPSETPPLTKH